MASEDKESSSTNPIPSSSHGSCDDEASLQLHMNNISPEVCEIKKEKSFLLVLDLNGLLIHPAHRSSKSINRPPDAGFGNTIIYKRPYSEEFIRFCLHHFHVALWSSVKEHNVNAVMEAAFGEIKSDLLFIWGQTKCSYYGIQYAENSRKPLLFKKLKKVWDGGHEQFKNTKTLLIDDSPAKGLLNPPNTGIYLDSYDPQNMNDNALDPKGELASYLKGLSEEAEEIPSYVASHPFGKAAITPHHPHWNFYSRVLRPINPKANYLTLILVHASSFCCPSMYFSD